MTLTVESSLQQQAWNSLICDARNNDGAVVVLDAKTVPCSPWCRSPTTTPTWSSLASLPRTTSTHGYTTKDGEGFYALRPLATGETFFPGSTMKAVTSTAAYNLKPSLAGFTYPISAMPELLRLEQALCNDGSTPATPRHAAAP